MQAFVVHPSDGAAGDSLENFLGISSNGACIPQGSMTIKYRRQAISTRIQSHKSVQGNGSAEGEPAEVDEFKEVVTTSTEVSLALATTSDANEEQDLASSAVVRSMIAEASDSDEQTARQFTLGILSKFSEIRRQAQQDHWDPNPSNKSKFAVQAGARMLELKCYHDFNDVGPVPGVRVGDWYSYTYELLLIGLHRHLRGNICHLSSTSDAARAKYNNQSVVCSILIGENDRVNGEKLMFIGQGGKQKQSRAETGNLALMNSCTLSLPVRVIRREKDTDSDTGQRFTYYGLYKVTKYFLDTGPHGHPVYKFFLLREGNQPGLDTVLPQPDPATLPGVLLTADISDGVEQTPVRVVNAVDVNAPDTFQYITAVVYPYGEELQTRTQACECVYTCEDGVCSCVKRNSGGVSAYNDEGHLIRVRNIVYECGPFCNCSVVACRNRVSQRGLRWRLEVFRTMAKGWGVRTLDFIPSGSFVCELTGELLTATVAAERENDEYLFNLDFHANARARNKASKGKVLVEGVESKAVHYVIDCRLKGNVARFINHSCKPNLFVQGVLHDHGDLNRGHIVLFAGEDIAAHAEISYDYGYELDSVRDVHGNVIAKECHCGARFCRKRMY